MKKFLAGILVGLMVMGAVWGIHASAKKNLVEVTVLTAKAEGPEISIVAIDAEDNVYEYSIANTGDNVFNMRNGSKSSLTKQEASKYLTGKALG